MTLIVGHWDGTEVLLLAVYHTVISLQNLTTNEHVPSLSGRPYVQIISNLGKVWQSTSSPAHTSGHVKAEVKNYYREGQNPFDYGGPGTRRLHTLENSLEGESKMECFVEISRFIQLFGEVQELQANLLLP